MPKAPPSRFPGLLVRVMETGHGIEFIYVCMLLLFCSMNLKYIVSPYVFKFQCIGRTIVRFVVCGGGWTGHGIVVKYIYI